MILKLPIFLGADLLGKRLLNAPIALDRRPCLVKGIGIVDADQHFELLAAIDEPPPLDDVELVGMRRAEIVDSRPVIQADRVDYQRVAFVMADRLTVP